MARSSYALAPALAASLLVGSPTPAAANPVAGVVAGIAIAYTAVGAGGQELFDSAHGRIGFSLAQVDEQMSHLEADCIPVEKMRVRGDLYDRLDRLRMSLQDDPTYDTYLTKLDRLREMPHGEEAYYVALLEEVYDYVGYPFPQNRYYVGRAAVLATNPCQLPMVASSATPTPSETRTSAIGAMP